MSTAPFVHPQALCESTSVGAGTRIWAFAHVMPGAVIGAECNVGDGVYVEGKAVIGNRCTLKNGVQVWDGVTLEDDVFVGPNATFTNDFFPRSRHRPAEFPRTLVKAGASIGGNATILPGITIGERAMVGAGTLVNKDVAPGAIVVGNPARVIGHVDDTDGEDTV
ncbi:MAG: N-acetyltransferase [Archangium sp.]|nr:N-acetyltransferase [Archangium sp.]